MEPHTTCKRSAIVRAALELIAEKGFHGAPAAMIADRAGVGAGTIYRYFENKDVLIRGLYQEVESRITTTLLEDYPASGSVRERFCHIGRALLRHFIANPLEFRFIEQFVHSPFGATVRREKILGASIGKTDMIWALMEEGIRGGSIKDLPILLLFALSFGPLIMASRDHALGFVELTPGNIELTVDACWDAMARRPSPDGNHPETEEH